MSGVTFHPVATPFRVHVLSAHLMKRVPEPTLASVDDVWREMSAREPALYDGPNLRVLSADVKSGFIVCERSSFKHFVTAPRVGRDLRQLGIVGWVTCGEAASADERLLIARRSGTTRVFRNMWENAPSGGVQVRPPGVGPDVMNAPNASFDAVLGPADLYRSLEAESEEELGFALPPYHGAASGGCVRFLGWVNDGIARSLDLVVAIHLSDDKAVSLRAAVASEAGSDEYSRRCWLRRANALNFVVKNATEISPPTLTLLLHLGWLDP